MDRAGAVKGSQDQKDIPCQRVRLHNKGRARQTEKVCLALFDSVIPTGTLAGKTPTEQSDQLEGMVLSDCLCLAFPYHLEAPFFHDVY